MKLKEYILMAAQLVGLNLLSKMMTKNKPRVIMFHKVVEKIKEDATYPESISLELLDEVFAYIKKAYTVYTLKDLVQYRLTNDSYPSNAIVLTFDDGFCSFQDSVLPLLKKHELKATVFICPLLIEQNTTIWPELLADASENNSLMGFNQSKLPELIAQLKTLSTSERDNATTELFQHDYCFERIALNKHRQLMTWEDLKGVISSGLVEVGSHSMSHPILSKETDEDAMFEIEESKKLIEKRLGLPVVSFCYPNGQADDYTFKHVNMLKNTGYLCAVNSTFGLLQKADSCYEIPRFGGDFKTMLDARKYIDGVEHIQRKFLERDK